MELNFVDLFSCGGGMSTGFTKQGSFRTIGAVDLEVAKPCYGVGATNCNDTYEANLGLRPLSANLAHTPPEEISSHFGFSASDVDVLISCAPCTGFSQKKANNYIEDDARNQLVERTALYAEAWRPRYVVIENVKELLNGRHKHHFQGLHRSLTRLGYEVLPRYTTCGTLVSHSRGSGRSSWLSSVGHSKWSWPRSINRAPCATP